MYVCMYERVCMYVCASVPTVHVADDFFLRSELLQRIGQLDDLVAVTLTQH